MKDELFQELLQSVREMGAIVRGELEPARSTQFKIGGVGVEPTLKHVISVPLTTGETAARDVKSRAQLFAERGSYVELRPTLLCHSERSEARTQSKNRRACFTDLI